MLFAYHPCTPQHGQQLRGGVETHLNRLGFSAARGTQRIPPVLWLGGHLFGAQPGPVVPTPARDRKLGVLGEALGEQAPDAILSANIGCITHLRGTATPVRHWVEVLDEALGAT